MNLLEWRELATVRPPTMQDVADRAGVSTTTVSHMLSGRRAVSESTKRRIQSAIDDLKFRPNDSARALRTQKTKVVAMILGNIAHEANPLIARGAGEVMREKGFTLAIYETNDDSATTVDVIGSVSSRRTDGAIVLLQGAISSTFEPLTRLGIPVVYAGPPNSSWPSSRMIYSDEETGIELATGHVLSLTDGQVGFIGGPEGDPNATARRIAFERVMVEAHRPLDIRQMTHSPWSFDGGQTAMSHLLNIGISLGGVVCANDLIAIGAIQHARKQGLRIPEDLVVTGFDNIEAAAMVDPPLTTVEPFEIEVGRAAARAVLAAIEGEPETSQTKTVTPKLIIRRSAPSAQR